jgi:protein SCO1/2
MIALHAALATTLLLAAPAQPVEVGIDEQLGRTAALDQPLRDEQGGPVTLRSLLGKPTLLTLNYFRCAGVCTPQLQGVVELLNRSQAEPGRDFQVVTVSFDPRDTPPVAARKQANHLQAVHRPISAASWRFLTGDAAATRALADSVGFRFKAQGSDFIHPAALIVLSPKGTVTRYLYGTSYLPADVALAVDEAARGEARPTINRMLSICFSYDPVGRRYVVDVTRLAGAVILAAAGAGLVVLLVKGRRGRRAGGEGA